MEQTTSDSVLTLLTIFCITKSVVAKLYPEEQTNPQVDTLITNALIEKTTKETK
jgi:hypothetical protein